MGELIWTRRYSFQSVHSLDSGPLRERHHGHHYLLEVSFTGNDVNFADSVVEDLIARELHARELSALNPSTGEHIVDWVHGRLAVGPLGSRLRAVALQETRKNRFVSAMSEERYV